MKLWRLLVDAFCIELVIMWCAILGVVFVSIVLMLFGVPWAAMFGYLSMATVVIGNIVYIVAFDSRKRWPGVSWFYRYSRVLTFYRDPK